MSPKVHREGYGTIFAFSLASLFMTLGGWIWFGDDYLKVLAILGWLFTLFSAFFFRDPDRAIPQEKNGIVSPADGKVIEISETTETEYLKQKAIKVSIFLSIFDVHVNRAPVDGVVKYFRYKKGRFLRAYLKEASLENEQTVIGVENGQNRLLFKQIAGLIARRIFCDIREGHKIRRGERIGIIKFGSRVDVFVPVDQMELRVQLHDKVKAGESLIGVFKDVS